MEEIAPAPPSALPVRVLEVFFSPGKLFESLREKPLWFGALFVGGLFVAVTVLLLPGEMLVSPAREAILREGGEVPSFMEGPANLFKVIGVLAGVLFWFVWAFFLSAVVLVVFNFLFGDEGRYAQYLTVVSHALIIGAVGGILLVPLRIAQQDAELTLSVGTFFSFLDAGYLLRVLKGLDLFGLWGYAVMAVGVTKIDPKRSLGSAMAVFFTLALVAALLFGIRAG